MNSNIIAIVGRPNVGKSTLFNRLIGERKAIVEETSGVTRDRHYGKSEWNGLEFSIIDTGGYAIGSDDIFESEIREQVEIAIEEAFVIIFVLDTQLGILDYDKLIADLLRKSGKKVFIAANKVDSHIHILNSAEFYSLGLGEIYNISAINGSGTGELLDDAINYFKEKKVTLIEDETMGLMNLAIVGKPNVGKSSLLNTLLNEKRNIVTPISGTTRDTLKIRFNKFGFDFNLIDTAGIRRKKNMTEDIEYYSILRSIRAIEESDVCIFMIDVSEGISQQDLNILSIIKKNNKGIVMVLNKWDLVTEKDHNTMIKMEKHIISKIAPFTDIPMVFTSVINKQRLLDILHKSVEVYNNKIREIKTSELNDFLLPLFDSYPPPAIKGKYIKIKYATQIKKEYPIFAIFCNLPQYIKDPYKRFVENKLREKYNFEGVPMKLFFRKK